MKTSVVLFALSICLFLTLSALAQDLDMATLMAGANCIEKCKKEKFDLGRPSSGACNANEKKIDGCCCFMISSFTNPPTTTPGVPVTPGIPVNPPIYNPPNGHNGPFTEKCTLYDFRKGASSAMPPGSSTSAPDVTSYKGFRVCHTAVNLGSMQKDYYLTEEALDTNGKSGTVWEVQTSPTWKQEACHYSNLGKYVKLTCLWASDSKMCDDFNSSAFSAPQKIE